MVSFILIGILGAALGSFAGAQVWRLRARQLVEDKAAGEKVDAKELKNLKPLIKGKLADDRSRCLSCRHVLAWHDLVPVVSWVLLLGKCRYCRKPIGWTELILELVLGIMFVLSIMLWPGSLTDPWQAIQLVLWLISLVLLSILFVYDLKWQLLPDIINLPFVAVAALFAGVRLCLSGDVMSAFWNLLGSIFILSGIYFILYVYSRMRFGEEKTWIGFGDVKLGLGLGLLLADWQLAFLALFTANLIGTIIILPSMLLGRLRSNSRIAFGPLLVAGFLLSWLVGPQVLGWYLLAL